MAGNAYDWTIEADYTDSRVFRGGNYADNGSSHPASDRYSNGPAASNLVYGSRVALYM